ncbi:M57 family metalloprotease [Ekhidna sp.]|uniref:M57 family metalloprotease n=1 Tax=Ekhidna sp. TaxID=2608089 RepID=UPI0032992928
MRRLNLALWSVLVMFLAFGFTSCSTEDEPQADEISDEVLAQFSDLGFDVSDIQMINHRNPLTGVSSKQYQLEGDILIPEHQMREMLESTFELGQLQEQYRTSNLVSNNQTISVIGYTGGSNALDNTMRTALQWAVNNYNRINIGLNFTLAFGTNYQSYDMVVYKVSGGGGGSAGFPSGGNPYKFIQIQSGTSSYGTNTTEHVITHEMGHCLGLRHTDYFNRSLSCGSGGNEGSGGVGAIHIPGTPTGFDANSVMLSCFSANEDGEFGSYDVTALEYLY